LTDTDSSRLFHRICRVACGLALAAFIGFVVVLSAELTYIWPLGGNDEPMHLSMSHYIARHLEWPRWDSEEIERYFGISYATSPSLNYWFDGLIFRWTGHDRVSQVLLFLVCAGCFAYFARRNGLAGLFACAVIVPQVVFIFSYVNSDAWTVTIALLLGIAVDAFLTDPLRTRNIFALFVTASACLTCRYHLWFVGFVAFALALLPRLRLLWSQKRRALLGALGVSLLIASWWPLTSSRANDGDPIGFRAGTSERIVFSQPNDPEFMAITEQFDPADFFERMLKSFYGWWGWATIALPWFYYKAALLTGLPLLVFAMVRHSDRLGLILLLLAANINLMLWRAVTYHSVLWQGRYLFPAFFIAVGILVHREASRPRMQQTSKMGWFVASWAAVVVGFNLWATAELFARSGRAEARAEANPPHLRGQMMLHTGRRVHAKLLFKQALREDPEDYRSHNALGYMLLLEGNYPEARLHLEAAKKHEPFDAQIRLNLGIVELKEGKPHDAIREFQGALDIDPDSALLYYYVSVAYADAGELGQAIQNCQRALEINPSDVVARAWLKSLLEQTLKNSAASQ
jgi:tetratricopeptide (TPR) repeat protein